MEKLALTLARSGRGAAGIAFDPELSRVFATLTDAELDTELAYDVVGKLTAPIPEGALRAEVAKQVRVESELGLRGAPSRIVALVGPPGAGKTSALVKLAVQCGLAARKERTNSHHRHLSHRGCRGTALLRGHTGHRLPSARNAPSPRTCDGRKSATGRIPPQRSHPH